MNVKPHILAPKSTGISNFLVDRRKASHRISIDRNELLPRKFNFKDNICKDNIQQNQWQNMFLNSWKLSAKYRDINIMVEFWQKTTDASFFFFLFFFLATVVALIEATYKCQPSQKHFSIRNEWHQHKAMRFALWLDMHI